MIGIKDTLELTAALHGGKRLADRIFLSPKRNRNQTGLESEKSPNRHEKLTNGVKPRHNHRAIALPAISDEVSRYRATTGLNRAA